jgi:mannitol/fructose-specific phosphotransferase system IIA component (Ntr-type)
MILNDNIIILIVVYTTWEVNIINKIQKKHMQIVDEQPDYKAAIKLAAKPLIDDNLIESPYVDAVLKAIKDLGPYICLADDFALPHARPSEHVKETSLSLLIIKKGVDLEGNRVKVMVFLAAKDSLSHQKVLQKLANFLMEPDNIQDLIKCNDVDEIDALLEERWN